MNRLMVIPALIVAVVVALSGCAETTSGSNEDGTGAINAEVCGTYVGERGSFLTLFEDGNADYYWYEYEDVWHENPWSYKDGSIQIELKKMFVTITAEVPNEGNVYNFVGSNLFWDDEKFEKVTSESKSLSTEEFRATRSMVAELELEAIDDVVETVEETNDVAAEEAADAEQERAAEEAATTEQDVTGDVPASEVAGSNEEASESAVVENVEAQEEKDLLLAEELKLYLREDYTLGYSDGVVLGNDEGVTVTINAPEGTTVDDLWIYYDENILDCSYQEESSTASKIVLYVTGVQAGMSDLIISTYDEIDSKGESAIGHTVSIKKLDSSEGRVVYITPNGEKYHTSASCAGENAMKATYHDSVNYGYEPCGKCAK